MLRQLALIFLLPCGAFAQEPVLMSGDAITQVLNERDLIYENATQRFFASGRTLYNAGQDSWGYWAVRADQYCSQWPPGDGWDCYDVAEIVGGVRFIAADGSFSEGMFKP